MWFWTWIYQPWFPLSQWTDVEEDGAEEEWVEDHNTATDWSDMVAGENEDSFYTKKRERESEIKLIW